MCRGEHPVDMQTIQPHLDRIKAPVSTAKDHHVSTHSIHFNNTNLFPKRLGHCLKGK